MKYWKVYGMSMFDEDAYFIEEGSVARKVDPSLFAMRVEEITLEEYNTIKKLVDRAMTSTIKGEQFGDSLNAT